MSGDETIDPRSAAMTEASPDAPDAYLARIAQARALREQAGKGGLRFEAYLPPDLADWLLDLIEELYSAAYWDLFTNIWRKRGPIKKTDAVALMSHVKSPQTAKKYVDYGLEKSLLVESADAHNKRLKLINIADDMRSRPDLFLDQAISELRQATQRIAELGPSPREP